MLFHPFLWVFFIRFIIPYYQEKLLTSFALFRPILLILDGLQISWRLATEKGASKKQPANLRRKGKRFLLRGGEFAGMIEI